MKNFPAKYLLLMLLFWQFALSQDAIAHSRSNENKKVVALEVGLNFSLPVHIQMYRSHRLAIGGNLRAWKPISPRCELGIKGDYDYRFIKKNSKKLITENSTVLERALHSNFSLFSIKPNVQFRLNYNWYVGLESGLGYVLSDENNKVGLGFVSEFGGYNQFGWCSGLYLGKYFNVHNGKNKIGTSLDFTQYVAHGHAENSLGIKLKYRFDN